MKKFQANAETCFPSARVGEILALFEDLKRLEQMTVNKLLEPFVPER